MKFSARLLTVALLAVPAVPAMASPTAAAAPVTVARYTFDGGASAGRVAEVSGRGTPLTVRNADRGAVRFIRSGAGRFVGFPAPCAPTAQLCPRALFEGSDDPDLDPGTRQFRWAATVHVSRAQLRGSANVVQKGVYTTESQWKLQVNGRNGRAQCVIVGRGAAQAHRVESNRVVADGRWHRVLCMRSGTSLSIWVDGVNRGRITTVPATLTIANDKPLRIGGPNFNTRTDMYHGYVDNVYAILG